MGRWRSMKTAPKDGTRVIICAVSDTGDVRVGEASLGADYFHEDEWGWANDSCSCCYGPMTETPKFWMSLPAPLKQNETLKEDKENG